MPMITGQGAALQIGKENTWGTASAPSVAVNFTSENFVLNVDRTEEDTLVGGATSREMDIMKKSVSFDFDQLAKPDNIGFVIGNALGVEATVEEEDDGSNKHTFTMLKPSLTASLPSFTAIVNRHVAKKGYTGCKINSLEISCSAGDYMRLSVSGVGKDEVDGSAFFDDELEIPVLKAFRFAGGYCSFDGVEFGDVRNVTVSINNNLDEGEQTLGSGYYGTEPEPQKREVTTSIDTFYNAASNTVRENKYKTENKVAVVLRFESPSEIDTGVKYRMEIEMPLVVVNECSPVIGGTEKIQLTIGGTATESASAEAITIKLYDDKSSKYIA